LFIYQKGGTFLVLLIYVDDLVLIGSNPEQCHSFKAYLQDCFKLKDLGTLNFLESKLLVPQRGYFCVSANMPLDILTETDMLGAKPASFPMEQNHKLSIDGGKPLVISHYHSARYHVSCSYPKSVYAKSMLKPLGCCYENPSLS